MFSGKIRDVVRKKNGIMWEKFPKGGEGSDPNPLHIFLFFPIQGLIKWQKNGKKCENSQTGERGGGGPPLGNFSHIIPFFSDHVPK